MKYLAHINENVFKKMYTARMLSEMEGDSKSGYFVLNTLDKYTDEMGIRMDIGYGEAIIF